MRGLQRLVVIKSALVERKRFRKAARMLMNDSDVEQCCGDSITIVQPLMLVVGFSGIAQGFFVVTHSNENGGQARFHSCLTNSVPRFRTNVQRILEV